MESFHHSKGTMSAHVILAVDDDNSFLDAVEFLFRDSAQVVRARTVQAAKKVLSEDARVDLVITDFRIRPSDGHEVVAAVRRRDPSLPVIIVTAFADKDMVLKSANLQVFGILEKPIDTPVFVEMVGRALKTSSHENRYRETSITVGGLKLDLNLFSASYEGTTWSLTETEFQILIAIAKGKGDCVGRERIIEEVWGTSRRSQNLFDTHLMNLRKKVPPLSQLLKVVRGRGYRLAAEVESAS